MPTVSIRRKTILTLLIFLSGVASALHSRPTAAEQAMQQAAASARRTAAGLRALEQQRPIQSNAVQQSATQQSAVQPAGISQRSIPLRPTRSAFVPQRAAPAPQLLDVPLDAVPQDAAAAQDTSQQLVATQPSIQQPPIQPPLIEQPVGVQLPPVQPPIPQRSDAPPVIAAPHAAELVPPAADGDEYPQFVPPKLTGIGQTNTSIALPQGEVPRNFAALTQDNATQMLAPPDEAIRTSAPFYSTPRAPDFTYRPLYFEERQLERNGRNIGVLQPVASFVHFFGTIPVLPYKAGAQPEARRLYTGNGIDIPGDKLTWRDRARGMMTQAMVAIGLSAALP